ncbi:hypothetical protein HY450_00145 [Candidatus Pacearchaeota archaeon]|nr:hypothetical protein [Candidatus Pacearchaeota archaeon]
MTNENEERELEKLIKHFVVRAGESGLHIDQDITTMEGYEFRCWPYIWTDSALSSLYFRLGPTYSLDFSDVLEFEGTIPRNPEKQKEILDSILQARPWATRRLIRSLASKLTPLPKLDCLDFEIQTDLDDSDYRTIFQFGLGYLSEPWGIRSPPRQENYQNKEGFERELRKWHDFYLPVIQKYGERFREIMVLGKELNCHKKGVLVKCGEYCFDVNNESVDATKRAIDLGFEICQDEQLDALLNKRGAKDER